MFVHNIVYDLSVKRKKIEQSSFTISFRSAIFFDSLLSYYYVMDIILHKMGEINLGNIYFPA